MDNNAQKYKQTGEYQAQYSCCDGKIFIIQQKKRFLLTVVLVNLPAILHEVLHTSWFSTRAQFSYVILFIIMHFINYYCMLYLLTSDPGIIPKIVIQKILQNYDYDINETFAAIPKNSQHINGYQSIAYIDVSKNQTFKIKLCSTCNIYRPPRASHCSECGVCIERLDHHCSWLGTCIGKRNYKHFYLFLATTLIMLLLLDLSCITIMARNEQQFGTTLSNYPMTLIFCILSIPPICLVSLMLTIHTYLLFSDLTTKQYVNESWNPQIGNLYQKRNCIKNITKVLFKIPESQVVFKGKKFRNHMQDKSSQSQSTKKDHIQNLKKVNSLGQINDSVSRQSLQIKYQLPYKTVAIVRANEPVPIRFHKGNIITNEDQIQYQIPRITQRNHQQGDKTQMNIQNQPSMLKVKSQSNYKR